MARRKRFEEHVNHERWLVSYADFITLLFAFFVVMYSISSVNEDKYRVLSDAMVSAFRDPSSVEPIRVERLVQSPLTAPAELTDVTVIPETIRPPLRMDYQDVTEPEPPADIAKDGDNFSQQILDEAEAEVDIIANDVEQRMEAQIDSGVIDVKRNKFWLEVEIKSSLLFTSGSSNLIPESVPLLIKLSDTFVDMPNRIHIEGFTDNEPIKTPLFPSNWELSSARAAAVVRLFEGNGVEPSRLASIGYGEYHPLTDNESEEARARNRRVVIVVLAALPGQEQDRIYEFELLKERSGR